MPIERLSSDVRITPPTGPVDAALRPPGSKSLTNRYLACLALADGASTIHHASVSDDGLAMAEGLAQLGVKVEIDQDAERMTVHGLGGRMTVDDALINVGHAGTAMRFLTALSCLARGRVRLDGSARMRERPIGPLVDVLRDLGAQIGYELTDGCPPLTMLAEGLVGGRATFDRTPSSQYVSAVLMAAPYAANDVLLEVRGGMVSRPYLDMTLDVMRAAGVEVLEHQDRFIVAATQRYGASEVDIEPDASGATYLWAAAAITGGRVRVQGLTRASRQGDAAFVDVLEQMGATVREGPDYLEVQGPPVDAQGRPRLRGVDVDLNVMPDTVQTLAVVALFADGPTTVRNVANLRIKETDRIAALEAELTKLGARVETRSDGLTVHPTAEPTGAEIATYDDHRMAMALALAGLRIPGVVINDAQCVSKSYPRFWDDFGKLAAA